MISNFDTCPKCGGSGLVWGTTTDCGHVYETVSECECQLPSKLERMLRKSGIDYARYAEMSLENFSADTTETAKMRELALAFLKDQNALGIGYFGKAGTGKTHICIAICLEMTRTRLIPHRYFSYRWEIQRLKALMYDEEAYRRETERFSMAKALYIDDLFKLAQSRGKTQDQDMQIMYGIINDRYINKRLTLFSSEYTLNDIMGIDEAIGSRIYEMCFPHLCRCEGKNRRIRR
jgi:DNA replication protein DnaC